MIGLEYNKIKGKFYYVTTNLNLQRSQFNSSLNRQNIHFTKKNNVIAFDH